MNTLVAIACVAVGGVFGLMFGQAVSALYDRYRVRKLERKLTKWEDENRE